MTNGKHIVVVMPAYNAAKTREMTVHELPDTVDKTIQVDNQSKDETVPIAQALGWQVFVHDKN
jgi:glycosyltransferase involved in cell wall biosynthesis